MEVIAFALSVFGFIAFGRVEKLIKTLKKKGVLDDDYKSE